MARITSLPDLSRFVLRETKSKIYNSINLLIGTDVIEVSGCVIAQSSNVLEELVKIQSELYLDQFVGELDAVYDVVELLYGGSVGLHEGNVKTICKFSILYEVVEMYELCFTWVKENITTLDLFSLIQFGIQIECICKDNHDILTLCSAYIKEDIKDDLTSLSESWRFTGITNFVRFLLSQDILYFTLPVLTLHIHDDASVEMVLTQLEAGGVVLSDYGERASDLLEKMSDFIEELETSKKLNKVQNVTYRTSLMSMAGSSKTVPVKDFTVLLTSGYRSFPIDKILNLEAEYSLTHFQFVEISLEWILCNKASHYDNISVWNSFRQRELAYNYVTYVRDPIIAARRAMVPKVENRGLENYTYFSDCIQLSQLTAIELEKKCDKCYNMYTIRVEIVDSAPCFRLNVDNSDCVTVEHLYLSSATDKGYDCFSLLTNNYRSVVEKIKKCWGSNTDIYYEFMYRCTAKKVSDVGGKVDC